MLSKDYPVLPSISTCFPAIISHKKCVKLGKLRQCVLFNRSQAVVKIQIQTTKKMASRQTNYNCNIKKDSNPQAKMAPIWMPLLN